MNRPAETDYPEWYDGYVKAVPDGDILDLMEKQLKEAAALLNEIDEQKSLYKYSPGKWSIKELLGHINDTERIFAYRTLRFARFDRTNLASFEQDEYVANANFDSIPFEKLVKEFRFLRKATISLFSNFTEQQWSAKGLSNNREFTVLAMGYITVGHVNHHLRILRERYL